MGRVPGADQAAFEEAAGKAKAGCPVSSGPGRGARDHLEATSSPEAEGRPPGHLRGVAAPDRGSRGRIRDGSP